MVLGKIVSTCYKIIICDNIDITRLSLHTLIPDKRDSCVIRVGYNNIYYMGKNVLSYLGTVFPDRSHNISNILIMNIIINITTVQLYPDMSIIILFAGPFERRKGIFRQ